MTVIRQFNTTVRPHPNGGYRVLVKPDPRNTPTIIETGGNEYEFAEAITHYTNDEALAYYDVRGWPLRSDGWRDRRYTTPRRLLIARWSVAAGHGEWPPGVDEVMLEAALAVADYTRARIS